MSTTAFMNAYFYNTHIPASYKSSEAAKERHTREAEGALSTEAKSDGERQTDDKHCTELVVSWWSYISFLSANPRSEAHLSTSTARQQCEH